MLKLIGLLFSAVAMSGPGAWFGGGQSPVLADAIRNRLEAGSNRGEIRAAGDLILAARALPLVYGERGFSPIWFSGDQLSAGTGRFLRSLREGDVEGLRPEDYHLATIDSLRGASPDNEEEELGRRVDLELLLSDAFLVYGSHLLQGRVNPVSINPEWLANRRNADMGRVLTEAVATGDFQGALEALLPRQAGYGRLKEALARFRDLAASGGWGSIPEGATFREGESDPRVPALRARLLVAGDLPDTATEGPWEGSDSLLFDPVLGDAVRGFQRRHGLDADGAVGAATLAALNVPVQERIRQLEVNLERWRWLPEDLGRRHILVNIAGFSVSVVEGEETVLDMRAIVGRQYRETPVFSSRMTYLVLSPYWHVPPTIAAVDKLPEIRKDPGYLAAQRMTLLDAFTNLPVDPTGVDWSVMTGAEFNRTYRIRQDPGPNNALGDVKFMFPNPHNVYLHDTPTRELFARTERNFSSGCIRIEKPMELARYLLQGDPRWDGDELRAVINRRVETTVTLRDPVPVHLLYWTAWVGEDGQLNFRRDLYGRDELVHRALLAAPPGD